MLHTDIRHRAIPWSHLLLSRRELPATLNLDLSARWSAALSLLIPAAVAMLIIPEVGPWPAIAALAALVVLIAINRSFLGLLYRQGGVPLATAGAGLHLLYLLYSSISFLGVIAVESLRAPLAMPPWLKAHPHLTRLLIQTALVLLALLAAMFVLPVQAWLRQRDEISVKQQQLAVLDGANAQLTDEIEHLQTTEGAKEAARDELGVVGLGEQRTSLLPADLTGVALPGGWPYDAITQVVAVRAATTAPPPEAAPSTPAVP
jgi:cell division protein FtsB